MRRWADLINWDVPVPVLPAYTPGTWAYVHDSRAGRAVAVQVCCGPAAPLPIDAEQQLRAAARRLNRLRTPEEIRDVPPEDRTDDEIFRYGTHGPYVKPMPRAHPDPAPLGYTMAVSAAAVAYGKAVPVTYRSDQDSRPHGWLLALGIAGAFTYAILGEITGYLIGGAL